ncbi:septum formation family protein [Wenjunlia tyrosinilytica]|uniref:Septum formation-related domain-containing protein n=1 Tax=Wenjunlia tyrosinilytica TaxID=1544741 RepID=A0A917ZGE1_9ACTN|nr:septum formation family protein [Wenjunlia tyrosinilytica]GGO81649.1 hypothetical protein GCM10012280_06420 [Wenjunlia tyrosinilytica]
MTAPPPPPPPNEPPNAGGGFGPPQGFGPPPEGYGYPGPADGPPPDQGGYGYPGGYGGPGGYGNAMPPGPPYPPPGGPGPGGGGRNGPIAAAVIGGVVVLALAVGGAVALMGGGDGKKHPEAADSSTVPSPSVSPTPSFTPTFSPEPLPSISIPMPSINFSDLYPSNLFSSTPRPTGSTIPYVALKPGQCFNTPGLDKSVDHIVTLSCSKPHDGEVIGNATLSGTFSSDKAISTKAGELCRPKADRAAKRQADGRIYYNYVLHPVLSTYQVGIKTVSCSLTASNKQGGRKLTHPLK